MGVVISDICSYTSSPHTRGHDVMRAAREEEEEEERVNRCYTIIYTVRACDAFCRDERRRTIRSSDERRLYTVERR